MALIVDRKESQRPTMPWNLTVLQIRDGTPNDERHGQVELILHIDENTRSGWDKADIKLPTKYGEQSRRAQLMFNLVMLKIEEEKADGEPDG